MRLTRYMKDEIMAGFGLLALISVPVAAIWGYIWNIVKLVAIVDGGLTGMLVLRAIGVVVLPLGCIVGFL